MLEEKQKITKIRRSQQTKTSVRNSAKQHPTVFTQQNIDTNL